MGTQNLYVGRLPDGVAPPLAYGALRQTVKQSTGALIIGLRDRASEQDHVNPPENFQIDKDMLLIYLATEPVLPEG